MTFMYWYLYFIVKVVNSKEADSTGAEGASAEGASAEDAGTKGTDTEGAITLRMSLRIFRSSTGICHFVGPMTVIGTFGT